MISILITIIEKIKQNFTITSDFPFLLKPDFPDVILNSYPDLPEKIQNIIKMKLEIRQFPDKNRLIEIIKDKINIDGMIC